MLTSLEFSFLLSPMVCDCRFNEYLLLPWKLYFIYDSNSRLLHTTYFLWSWTSERWTHLFFPTNAQSVRQICCRSRSRCLTRRSTTGKLINISPTYFKHADCTLGAHRFKRNLSSASVRVPASNSITRFVPLSSNRFYSRVYRRAYIHDLTSPPGWGSGTAVVTYGTCSATLGSKWARVSSFGSHIKGSKGRKPCVKLLVVWLLPDGCFCFKDISAMLTFQTEILATKFSTLQF